MAKNIYLVLATIALGYFLLFKDSGTHNHEAEEKMTHINLDSIYPNNKSTRDSLNALMLASDSLIGNKIEKTSQMIVGLKNEVVQLKEIIKEKDNTINELKKNISDFSSDISSKFKLFAVPEEDRK